jgi:hypothetical protein
MSSKPPVLDSDCGSMDLIQRHLTALDGSRGKFVTYKPSHAAVVLWIASVHVLWLKTKLGYIKLSCGWQYVVTQEYSDDMIAYEQFFRLVDADPGIREFEEDS